MRRVLFIPILICGLILAGVAAFELAYINKVYPKVFVAGINLGNHTVDQASSRLARALNPKPLTLSWGTSEWEVSPSAIGLEYDATSSAKAAYHIGRQGSVVDSVRDKTEALTSSKTVDPVFSWQENQLVEVIASVSAQINIPAREPEIQVDDSQITVSAGENGQAVDERQLRLNLQQAISGLSATVPVPVVQLSPRLTSDQAGVMRQRAQKLLGQKQVLTWPEGSQEIDSELMFTWLEASGWNREHIVTWVAQLATGINRPAQNALFNYVGLGKVEEFKPAKDGLAVKQNELVDQIIERLNSLETTGETAVLNVSLTRTPPAIATSEVNNLGIKELVGRGESNFTGSIANRIFNIKKAASNMNGILVAPGATFSFNQYVGDISTEGGYRQAYIIKDGKTILGDGGGVCQVSTTLFRAALSAGLPIVERTAHAYRVHYYEQDSQPGFDATVFTPAVDFKFKNDTPAYILIQARVDEAGKKLVFELYGTPDGRQVTLSKARVWDIVAPPPDLYTDDPTLPAKTVKQVDWKAWGAKVAFDYKVTRGGETLQQRTFYSNYRPWQAVYLRGPTL